MRKGLSSLSLYGAFICQLRTHSSAHDTISSKSLAINAKYNTAPRRSLHNHDGRRRTLNEPQLVAQLIEHFPQRKRWVTVGKWTSSIPTNVQEVLAEYGGLIKFARAQSNFFTVGKENGLNVIGLSTMAHRLQVQQSLSKEKEQKESEKLIRKAKRITIQQMQ